MPSPSELLLSVREGETQGTVLADVIRRELVSGVFAPGAKLKVRELADRYGVGATPVREALSRLVPSTLVIAEDHRGFRVADVNAEELRKLTWTRIQAETIALKDSLARGGVEWEGALVAAHHRLTRTPRPKDQALDEYRAWERAHEEFHAALLSGCDSPWLLDFIASLSDQCNRYRRLSGLRSNQRPRGAARNVEAEHKALFEAALGRRAEAATRLLESHFQATANLVLERDDFRP
jgi:DNA-binding GntR family transcriptional regulator